ncbi:MAG: hypothetical protein JG781_2187 [Peptococcaceae bacterium]|nr:hypothetical protein [Peptococcaceae bacterium]
MFNVYVADQLLASYPKKQEAFFQAFCAIHNISFRCNEVGDYILFPPLKSIHLVICPLNDNNQELNQVVKRLADGLKAQGALVLFSSYNSFHSKLMKMLKVQIFLSFTNHDCPEKKGKVRFFYSLKQKEESLQVVASIIKYLAQQKEPLEYEIPGLWDFVLNFKYNKLYLSDVPSVLMELDHVDLTGIEYLEKAIIDGLLDKYGKIPLEDQLALLKELAGSLEKEKTTAKVENEKEEEIIHEEIDPVIVEEIIFKEETLLEVNEATVVKEETNIKEKENINEEIELLNVVEIINESEVKDEPEVKDQPQQQVTSVSATENKINKVSLPAAKINNTDRKQAVTGVIKKKYWGKRSPFLYPPEDGPVFPFAPRAREDFYQQSYISSNTTSQDCIKSTFSQQAMPTPEIPWQKPQQQEVYRAIMPKTHNALLELKNLADTVCPKETNPEEIHEDLPAS